MINLKVLSTVAAIALVCRWPAPCRRKNAAAAWVAAAVPGPLAVAVAAQPSVAVAAASEAAAAVQPAVVAALEAAAVAQPWAAVERRLPGRCRGTPSMGGALPDSDSSQWPSTPESVGVVSRREANQWRRLFGRRPAAYRGGG